MNIGVPSRYACLKIEDDEKGHRPPSSGVAKGAAKPLKKEAAQQSAKKKTGSTDKKNDKATKQGPKKEKKGKQPNEKQWQEWQEKDHEFVAGNFEVDLQNAILLSKLDLEENTGQNVIKTNAKTVENDKKPDAKKKKSKVMSLDQFLSSQNNKVEEEKPEISPESDRGDFFTSIQNDTKIELNKDLVLTQQKERNSKIDENISIGQYQVKLDREVEKNKILKNELLEVRQQLQRSQEDIAEIKVRNKQLCAILGQGEMKDKAGVLVDLERLNNVKTELTEEIARLHVLLEKERSKNANNNEHIKHKDKKSKKH